MASEIVSCPECQRKLRVPGDLVGKMVKCPTCGQTFTADPAALAPPPAPVEERPARTSKVSRDDKEDEDDEERSRRRRASRRDDDDEDDRPRRRSRYSRDDDEDDDRPRRRDLAPHRGAAVLTMGILGLVLTFLPAVPVSGLVLGIIAWVMGNTDLAEIRAGRMDPEGEGSTNGGRICGMIAVILHLVVVLVFVIFFGCLCLGGAAGARH